MTEQYSSGQCQQKACVNGSFVSGLESRCICGRAEVVSELLLRLCEFVCIFTVLKNNEVVLKTNEVHIHIRVVVTYQDVAETRISLLRMVRG